MFRSTRPALGLPVPIRKILEIQGGPITFESPENSWQRLGNTLKDYDVALFLGAGVSRANRMPTWNEFVEKLGAWSSAERYKLAATGLSVATLCEVARRRVPANAWTARVRSAIYDGFVAKVRATEGLSLSDFGSKGTRARKRVSKFFRTDSPRMLRTVERASAETEVGKIPLYQLHGYLSPPQAHLPSGRLPMGSCSRKRSTWPGPMARTPGRMSRCTGQLASSPWSSSVARRPTSSFGARCIATASKGRPITSVAPSSPRPYARSSHHDEYAIREL